MRRVVLGSSVFIIHLDCVTGIVLHMERRRLVYRLSADIRERGLHRHAFDPGCSI